jgi:aryl-alcohol dehydrogenase-like predicted oxidoreductase
MAFIGDTAVAQPATRSARLPDDTLVPKLGQGTWRLAMGRHPASEVEETLRVGISLGLTLIDTAEMYGDGSAEQMNGRVIAGQRDKVFLVSKVLLPYHVTASEIRHAFGA